MLPRTWATVIFLATLRVVFVTLKVKELSRVIGNDQIKRMFFGHGAQLVVEKRHRDAA